MGDIVRRISNIAVLFLSLLNNFVILDFYFYPILYKTSGYSMPIYFIICIIISLIFSIFIPNKSYNLIRNIKKRKYLKLLLTIYLIIVMILTLTFSSVSLASIFYTNDNSLKFLILFLIMSYFLSSFKLQILINCAFILSLVGLPIICYNLISHISLVDISSLYYFNITNIRISKIIMLIFIILDSYLYILFIPFFETANKKYLIIGNILYFIIELIESLTLVLMLGTSLQDYYGFGYFMYSIEPISGLVGNFDFVYIFMIVLSSILKISLSMILIKFLYFKKFNRIIWFIYPILFIFGYILIKNYYVIDDYLYLLIYLLIGILIIIFIFIRRFYSDIRRSINTI